MAFLRAVEHRVSERRRWSLLRRYLELAERMMNKPEATPLAVRSKIYDAIFEIRSGFTREYRARWG